MRWMKNDRQTDEQIKRREWTRVLDVTNRQAGQTGGRGATPVQPRGDGPRPDICSEVKWRLAWPANVSCQSSWRPQPLTCHAALCPVGWAATRSEIEIHFLLGVNWAPPWTSIYCLTYTTDMLLYNRGDSFKKKNMIKSTALSSAGIHVGGWHTQYVKSLALFFKPIKTSFSYFEFQSKQSVFCYCAWGVWLMMIDKKRKKWPCGAQLNEHIFLFVGCAMNKVLQRRCIRRFGWFLCLL